MLGLDPKICDLDALHYKRLSDLAFSHETLARRVMLVHRKGVPLSLFDTHAGVLPTPAGKVDDAQAWAERLHQEHPEAYQVFVAEPEALRAALSGFQQDPQPGLDLDAFLAQAWEARLQGPGLGIAPRREFLWNGLPMLRLQKFCDAMPPGPFAYVLCAFEQEEVWASLLVEFEDRKISGVRTFDCLPADELKGMHSPEQAPFLLALAANTLRKPAFGWFTTRADLEAWMMATDPEEKAEVFQRSLLEKRAVFDATALMEAGRQPIESVKPQD